VSPAVEPPAARPLGSPLIELESVVVRYGDKVVLGHGGAGLDVTVRRGTRLALLGPNGSGKTTFLSLLTSDHPQSYSLPIKFFGRSRLPAPGRPGLSLWEIQSRIGHSSPEIHAFFPKHLSVRRVLESAWADTYAGKPVLTPARTQMVDTFLAWWEEELRQTAPLSRSDDLDWARDPHHTFGGLPFGVQRLSLLLRALVKQPDLVILDEAFSGLDADTRDKAMRWIEHGERPPGTEDSAEAEAETKYVGLTASQALVVVSHVREEIPPVVDEWVRLPGEDEALETGRGVEGGRTAPGHIRTQEGWMRVWGLA
jgi:ABC-type molybdenum transport system ATPase subunit/photorepair protein PhrA